MYENAYAQGGALGTGIGMTRPAQARLREVMEIPRPKVVPIVYDSEPAQILVELGLFGFLAWHLLRLTLIWAIWRNFLAAKSGILGPIILVALLTHGLHLVNASVVLNHTANLFIWGLYGVSMIPLIRPSVALRHTPSRPRVSRDTEFHGSASKG